MITATNQKVIKQIAGEFTETSPWGQELLNLSFDTQELPTRLVLQIDPSYAQLGIGVYINDDIQPIIIEDDGYLEWDTEGFGTIEKLIFAKPREILEDNESHFYYITISTEIFED